MLIKDGWRVFGSTRTREKTVLLSNIGVLPVTVDVLSQEALDAQMGKIKPEIVISQLSDLPDGLEPSLMEKALSRTAMLRTGGTDNLLKACLKHDVRRIVVQSISFIYRQGVTPHRESDPLDYGNAELAETIGAITEMESKVQDSPLEWRILRYGKLYGPGTGFNNRPTGGPVHVYAAANAARLAATRGENGIYNIVEDDGYASNEKARKILGWSPEAVLE